MFELQKDMISFYVPCLNEEKNIGQTIQTIRQVMKRFPCPFEIVIVDDASTDETVRHIKNCQKEFSEIDIHLIQNRFCRGLGRNYFIAAQRAQGEYYMLVNGDAAEPPETLEKILSAKGQADAIVPYFGERETRTVLRRIISRTFTLLVNILSGHHLKYYNGPVLHKTENVRIWFAETAGFGYQAELLCRLLDEGITVKEVKVKNSDRESGISKAFRIQNILSVLYTLLNIFLRRFQRLSFQFIPRPQR